MVSASVAKRKTMIIAIITIVTFVVVVESESLGGISVFRWNLSNSGTFVTVWENRSIVNPAHVLCLQATRYLLPWRFIVAWPGGKGNVAAVVEVGSCDWGEYVKCLISVRLLTPGSRPARNFRP